MSTNCIRCVVNKRTGPDLLCDECRKPAVSKHPRTDDVVAKALATEGEPLTEDLLNHARILERELNEAGSKLLDVPIGNEHETYSLAKRCEIAITVNQYAWRQADEARKERDDLLNLLADYRRIVLGYVARPARFAVDICTMETRVKTKLESYDKSLVKMPPL